MSPAAPATALRCRLIGEADLPAAAALLQEGFPERGLAYWTRALDVLRTRADLPGDYPRFGQMLEAEGACVGVLLQIFVGLGGAGGEPASIRCNFSSWYVRPAYRGYAPLLATRGRRYPGVTYVNVSPAEHTWPILAAQGYRRYSEGQTAALAALSLRGSGARVRRYRAGEEGFTPEVAALLDANLAFGLIVLVCEQGAERQAFGFLPRRVKGVGRLFAQLAWCEDTDAFLRFAGPLGRWLALRGLPVVLLDGEEKASALVGRFFKDRAPKYFRGERPPRLNDLAYTEAVLFGA